MGSGNPLANGISSCILEENSNYDQILAGENIESKTAMLACARLIRAELPIGKVAESLRHQNKDLAIAAERYIESVDTPEARQLILSLYPNKAKILGARGYFKGDNNVVIPDLMFSLFESVNADSSVLYNRYTELEKMEAELQKELAENPEMIGAYSLENNFVRVYKDKAVFSWEEDASRYRERTLKRSEFKQLVDYVINERIDELPPFIGDYCEGEHEETPCDNAEFLMLTREGGRRVFVSNKEGKTKFLKDLNAMFEEMKKPSAKLKYWMEKSVLGLEILFENKDLKARTVWKNGDDIRLLIDDVSRREQIDKEIQKQNELEESNPEADWEKVEKNRILRYRQREYENFSWRKFEQKNLTDVIAQPDTIEFIPKRDNLQPLATDQTWKARTATFELRADEEGLYKISRGVKTKIRTGNYASPVVTANGRWALVVKYVDYMPSIVRVNLLTNKEFKVVIPSKINVGEIISFIPSLNKVLVGNSYFAETEGLEMTEVNRFVPTREQYFIDAETGIVQKAKGEIRPFFHESFRPLQSNGKPDEFWVAIPNQEKEQTQIGVFNAKTLTFKSLQTFPKIRFNSMEMWVDEKEAKIYFVYEGHLLSLPLNNPT
ncbi:MAG: hypothetical protein MUC29_12810 [Pyrinomonadaceae bacterium]|nr:hypothetical protein [Pyrinomonadaceae bacterium]